jgi:hypothetical protein
MMKPIIAGRTGKLVENERPATDPFEETAASQLAGALFKVMRHPLSCTAGRLEPSLVMIGAVSLDEKESRARDPLIEIRGSITSHAGFCRPPPSVRLALRGPQEPRADLICCRFVVV